MKTGLYFVSLNPIHTGHLIIANYIIEHSELDELWLVVSTHNPHKKRNTLANDYDRLHLVKLAARLHPKIKASDIEFGLPKPSYTIDTLTYLKEQYPEKDFVLIMGGDNLATFHKWKNYEVILRDFEICVYKRPDYELGELKDHPSITILNNAPMMQISSTIIRQLIKEGKSISYWVPNVVKEEIELSGMYV